MQDFPKNMVSEKYSTQSSLMTHQKCVAGNCFLPAFSYFLRIFYVRDLYGRVLPFCKGSNQVPDRQQQASKRNSADSVAKRSTRLNLELAFTYSKTGTTILHSIPLKYTNLLDNEQDFQDVVRQGFNIQEEDVAYVALS